MYSTFEGVATTWESKFCWEEWADHLGLLVWEEMPSAYRFTRQSVERLTREWMAVLTRELRFRQYIAIDVAAYVFGYALFGVNAPAVNRGRRDAQSARSRVRPRICPGRRR